MITVPLEHEAALRAAAAELDRIVSRADITHRRVVMDGLRLRGALGLGLPASMSPLARALATLDDVTADASAVERVVSVLDPSDASLLLRTADLFITRGSARVLHDVLAAHHQLPGARLAALLALEDPDRCAALLARVLATQPESHVDAVAAAYLARVDHGLSVPTMIADAWAAIIAAPDAWPARSARFSARLRGLARRDALAALPELGAAITEVGGAEIPHAIMAVLSRAVVADHGAAWSLGVGLEWLVPRALAVEALVVGAPSSPELETAVDAVLAAWRAGGWRVDTSELGALQLWTPLLGACATAGRPDIARRVIDTFEVAIEDIASAMVAGTRLRFARAGGWRPGLPLAGFTDPTTVAIWTIETLPALDLPWADYDRG